LPRRPDQPGRELAAMARLRGAVLVGHAGPRDQPPPCLASVEPTEPHIQGGIAMIAQPGAGCRSNVVTGSPIGPLTLVAEDGRLPGLYRAVAGHEPDAATLGAPALGDPDPVLAAAVSQLRDYFAGTLTGFDLPLALAGTDFQRAVWAALQAI